MKNNNICKEFILLFAVFTIMSGFMSPTYAKNNPVIMAQTSANPMMVLARIEIGKSVEMKNITTSSLILDKTGYRYEPIKAKTPFLVKNDVLIIAENISLSNAIVDGNLYISANNTTLNDLNIHGTIFIDIDFDGIWTFNNVTANSIEIISKENENDDRTPDVSEYADETPNIVMEQPAGDIGNPDTLGDIIAFLEIITVSDYNDKLIVVNKNRSLPNNWKPKDLVTVKVPYIGRSEAKYMRNDAAVALEKLFAKAFKDKINITAVSGFRSFDLQKIIYAKNVAQLGIEMASLVSALSGRSEHQTGLAMDISSKAMGYKLDQSFGSTREGKWLKENVAEFGFIIRYPEGKEALTGYTYEPWHIRYIGRDMALEIMNKDTTLEEYFEISSP